jgi:hypothetical protein
MSEGSAKTGSDHPLANIFFRLDEKQRNVINCLLSTGNGVSLTLPSQFLLCFMLTSWRIYAFLMYIINVVEVFPLSFQSQAISHVHSGVSQTSLLTLNPILWSSSVIQGKFLKSRPRLISCSSTPIDCSRLNATF